MREKHAVNLKKKKQVSLGVGSCEVAPLIQCVQFNLQQCITCVCVRASSGGTEFKTSAVPLPRGYRTSRENQNVLCKCSAATFTITGVHHESEEVVMHSCVCTDTVVFGFCFFQVALEVIEELCYEMGLHKLEAMEEYAIFLVTNRGMLMGSLSQTHTNT